MGSTGHLPGLMQDQDPCDGALANILEVTLQKWLALAAGSFSQGGGSGLWGAWKPSLGQSYCLLACRKAAYSCGLFWGSPGRTDPFGLMKSSSVSPPAFTWFLFGEEPKPLFLRTGSDRGAGTDASVYLQEDRCLKQEPNPGEHNLGPGASCGSRLPRPLCSGCRTALSRVWRPETCRDPSSANATTTNSVLGKPESRGLDREKETKQAALALRPTSARTPDQMLDAPTFPGDSWGQLKGNTWLEINPQGCG